MISGKHAEVSRNRLSVFTSKDKSSVNLFGKLYKEKLEVSNIKVYSVPNIKDRITFEAAKTALEQSGKPAKVGDVFGPSWSTHWFELHFEIPASWKGEEIQIVWDSECEALIWTEDGRPLQGFLGSGGEDRRDHYILSNSPAKGGEKFHVYVEMACTAMFGNGYGNGWGGLGPNPTDIDKKFTIKQIDIVAYDRLAHNLLAQFIIIADIAKQYPEESFRASQALYTANQIMNVFMLDDRSTWEKCLQMSSDFLKQGNSPQAHNISAIGHCHIDTAWLWPYAETKRKCARSWASQLRICERHPNYKFGCSQAIQFEWVKNLYPKLYEEVKQYAKKGQFVPIGAVWVEMDCNIPNGESFVRQFLYGQRFFKQEFGEYCSEFWLPDTFGYSAQLPQIIKNSGVEYFMTQKLSWAQFNKFPHHTFYWEGLDGTKVFTHFPPADTYNAQATVKELLHHHKNFKEKERCNESLMVFGHGDGGGGPLMEMVENLEFMRDVDGLGKVEMRSPKEFFDRCIKDGKDIATWSGELYFEYHRGTYTSQANNKKSNRFSEILFRNIELFSVVNHVFSPDYKYPKEEMDRLWKLFLLNQFHDVLPGSSINEVYRDSDEHYADIKKSGEALLSSSLRTLSPQVGTSSQLVWNSLAWDRKELITINGDVPPNGQKSRDGKTLVVCQAPAMSCSVVAVEQPAGSTVSLEENGGKIKMENGLVSCTFDQNGKLVSFYDKVADREAIVPGSSANQFIIYEDVPMYWDAWDVDVYHLEKRKDINDYSIKVVERGPLRASIEISVKISTVSSLKQIVSLNAISGILEFECDVDWHETHKFLKVEFPIDVRSLSATYEMQYGHVTRPTHWNTSWDMARFEVCAHKWADLSENDFGVALLNDCKYGYAIHGNVMRLSLLRSPKNPDPDCDMGNHKFKYGLLSHQGTFQQADLIRKGYNFNIPLIVTEGQPNASISNSRLFEADHNSVVIDYVKKAEDGDDVIVRLYESFGGRCSFRLKSSLPFSGVRVCNMLEETKVDESKSIKWENGGVNLKIKPFEVITLAFSVSRSK